MLKGLTEVRRQLLLTYPSKRDLTKVEWLSEVEHWAEMAYAKLVSVGPLDE